MLERKEIGFLNGKKIEEFRLKNENLEVTIINYGATLTSIKVLKANNTDVLLGYDSLEEYQQGGCYFGGLVGRCANRIGDASVEIDGVTYQLEENDGTNHHHSASNCTAFKVWDIVEEKSNETCLCLSLLDKEKEGSLPGNVTLRAIYELLPDGGLDLKVSGVSDKDTLLNVTSHGYFNLDGQGSGAVNRQFLRILSEEYTPINEKLLPMGIRQTVEETDFDFRTLRQIGSEIKYDHNYILSENLDLDGMRKAAVAWSEKSKICMELFTDCPCIQFYTGNFIEEQQGKNGSKYEERSGFCLEPQYVPNAVHLEGFEKPLVKKGQSYDFHMKLQFTVKDSIERIKGGKMEKMEDYKEELERSFRKLQRGDMVKGTIVSLSEDEMIVDLDYYAPGRIEYDEITDDPGFVADEHYKVGDEIHATILRTDDGAGNILLSMKEATKVLGWEELEKDMEEENILKVRVLQSVNGGVVAYAKGIRGFIPASHLSLEYVENLDEWVNKNLEVTPITVNAGENKLVLSAKVVAKKRQEEEIAKKMSHMIPGNVYEGVVDSIQSYGAFINLGDGLSGLLHISRISQKRLNSPSEVLKVGQKVQVKLLDNKDGKLSLSMKEFEELTQPVETDEIEVMEYKEDEISTSLGSLLSSIKLQ